MTAPNDTSVPVARRHAERLAAAAAGDAAALAAVHAAQAALPSDSARMVLVALYEVLS